MAKLSTNSQQVINIDLTSRVSDYNGTPLLVLDDSNPRFPVQMGSRKLQAVMDNLDLVKAFLKAYPVARKIELTKEQLTLWKKYKPMISAGVADTVKVKALLVKAGIDESTADELIDQVKTA